MSNLLTGNDQLRKLFAAVTEQTFQVEFGVADPPLIDYLSDMLVRFTRFDVIFKARDTVGKRLEQVAEMMMEAEHRRHRSKGELHRHIGDFTLFWTGVYPEALKRLRHFESKDSMIDYQAQGKRSYYLASTLIERDAEEQTSVLRRLSREFELCSEGLRRVRHEWEHLPKAS